MSYVFDNNVKNYALALAERAQDESAIFPVDRIFLEQYLDEIMSLDSRAFLYYNFELVNDLYVNRLFVCLPEVWYDITFDDLIAISERFTNVHSYFTLIKFTYKYVEIDIIRTVLDIATKNNPRYFRQIISYLSNQWNVLIKSEGDLEDFEDGFITVDYNEWKYIKQKFLTDDRVMSALLNLNDVKDYVLNFIRDVDV